MKRLLVCGLIPLVALVAGFGNARIDEWVHRAVGRGSARHAVASMGLAPSPENVELYLAVDAPPEPLRTRDFKSLGRAETRPPIPTNRPFSNRWTYGQLADRGILSIGIYVSDPSVRAPLEQIARDVTAAPNPWAAVHVLRSKDEFLHSLATDDLVLYFGHANLGRGIEFPNPESETPLPMAPDHPQSLLGQQINCKLFAYLGCRTDRYFRAMWTERFPRVDFVATTYVCHSTDMARDILQKLLRGLHQGHPLSEIVDSFNRGKASAILFGRVQETKIYGNPTNHPPVLFTH